MKLLSEGIALYLVLLSGMVRTISPNPDEGQRALPWPSWAWQRLSLLAVFPFALLLFLIALRESAWVGVGVAVVWVGLAGYALVGTQWLRATSQAPRAARLSAGASVAAGWAVLALSLAMAIAYALALILLVVGGFLMARDIVRDALRRGG